MNATGVDLLLRVVAVQIAAQPCEECREVLAGSAVAVRETAADQVVVEVVCRNCAHKLVMQVRPEGDGVERVG